MPGPARPDASPHDADRRLFLAATASAVAAATLPASVRAIEQAHLQPADPDEPPVPAGINLNTIAQAEKLAKVEYSAAEREQILRSITGVLALYDPIRDADLGNNEGPAEIFDPRLPGMAFDNDRRDAKHARPASQPSRGADEDLAFASIAELGALLRRRAVSSVEMTQLSIDRFKRIGPKLESVITLMEERALAQARRADDELARGIDRGPLHGLPWGAKDLFDTAGVRTTRGAEPFKDRVPDTDATVVTRLDDAGAVLVAKLSLGALAYGDIWFGGRTNNPWNLEQGSSGSSAGSAASVAAGLCAFTLGTETYGSIMSPSTRCGATGFRPTFGRVSRAGAMALCWSLDKVGPICRSADDCAYVLDAIAGADPADESTIDIPLNLDMTRPLRGMRVGYLKDEFDAGASAEEDAENLRILERLGCTLVPKRVGPGPFGGIIFFIISVEGAAAFDRLTRSHDDRKMKWQDDPAWPNTFRTTRLASAVEFMNARRLRRRYMKQAAELFHGVDALIAPRSHGALHALTNMTGHPAVTIRQGFRGNGTPFAVNLWAPLFGDANLLALAGALERELDIWRRRPPIS